MECFSWIDCGNAYGQHRQIVHSNTQHDRSEALLGGGLAVFLGNIYMTIYVSNESFTVILNGKPSSVDLLKHLYTLGTGREPSHSEAFGIAHPN